jgi:serine/threonine-protein kinase RsbW
VHPTALKFDIPSELSQSRHVHQEILDAVRRHSFTEDAVFAIKLAVEEALVNAIKHGNQLDASKRVLIEVRVDDRQFEIFVEDQGPGFDRHRVPDPTADENLTKCSGRGLLLMEAYMNTVEYSNHGRRVRMTKLNEG